MKKIIFLAFTAICILLSGCETNEPPKQEESETQVIFCWEPQDTLTNLLGTIFPDGKVRFVIEKASYFADEDPQVAGFTFTNKQFNVDTFNLVSNRDYQLVGYNNSNEGWLLADFTPKGQMQKYRIHFDQTYGSLLLELTDFK